MIVSFLVLWALLGALGRPQGGSLDPFGVPGCSFSRSGGGFGVQGDFCAVLRVTLGALGVAVMHLVALWEFFAARRCSQDHFWTSLGAL